MSLARAGQTRRTALRTSFTAAAALASLGALAATACGDTFTSCVDDHNCESPSAAGQAGESSTAGAGNEPAAGGHANAGADQGGSSGTDAGTSGQASVAGAAGTPSHVCDPTLSVADEPCLVSNDFAVFVSPLGNDDNDGSQDAPLATVTKAAKVANGDKLVLVCSATYHEHVRITAHAHVLGGFKCADWRAATTKPLFKPETPGPALEIDGVTNDLVLENLSFEVGDATLPGETVIAALVNAAPQVTLRGVTLKAGKGLAGANGVVTPFVYPEKAALKGNSEGPVGAGGGEQACTCQPNLHTSGGLGGGAVNNGQSGTKGTPDLGAGQGGDPNFGECGSGSSGKKGGDAVSPAPAAGAALLGGASSTGWTPAPGKDGSVGTPGQGGGGGASFGATGHGGGGGCGGCGGNGGKGGSGGGASIALFALDSPVTLVASTLAASDAGNGGNGAAGQVGQKEVGGGGSVFDTSNSCSGGSGGVGADGGAGGGAAGGISVGIVWVGETEPSVSTDSIITFGKAGAKGVGGKPGVNDGIPGLARKVLAAN